jgi:sporulation protein YlmC with PRC-barrel domain
LLAGFSLLAIAAAPAYANQDTFNKLDKDGNGTLSRQEYQAWERNPDATKASALIGTHVVNSQGEELGEIKDVVINLNGGKVHAAVLEFGGVLGMGEKNYAFPIGQLKPAKEKDKLVLNVDKEKLKNAQGFAKGQWPAMDDEYWGRIGSQGAGAGATKAQKLKLVRSSEMIGKDLQGKKGEDVGEIKDLTLSLKDGSVKNVMVDLDDGGQTMLPVSALTTGTGGKLLTSMSADQLKSATKKK